MGNIARGRGLRANIALGFALCYISLSTTPLCNISYSALTVVVCKVLWQVLLILHKGGSQEANIAQGEAKCYICLETAPGCNIFP